MYGVVWSFEVLVASLCSPVLLIFRPLADGVERFHAALKLLVSNRTRESYSWQFSFIFWSAVINDSLNEYSFTKQALYKSETGKLA